MLPILIDLIRGAGRRFSDARRRESDEGKFSRRGASRGYRAALSVVCRLLLVALMLNAFAVRAQTTEIVGSGIWNGVVVTPSCSNYTMRFTANFTYANGAYSGTIDTSNARGSNCQDNGPSTCTRTNFFAAAQDLLTTSQWVARSNAWFASCGNLAVIQSATFTSPDSISATSIGFDGRFESRTITRATTTPTSYALTVTKSGSGTGTVTSDPAGIDCGATCSVSFSSGTSITLTATPTSGSTFVGWSGACTGTATCSMTMDAAKTLTATFNIEPPIIGDPTQPVTPPPVVQTSYTVSTGAMPDAAATTTATGTLGTATVTVQLDLSKVLSATFAAASTYNVYLAALVPGRQLGTTGDFWFVKATNLGWQALAIPIASYLQNVAAGSADQRILIEIVRDTDISTLIGTEIYIGYGTSDTEMLTAERYRGVYKVQ